MNKKVVVGLVAVMAIAAMAMFSGCIDKAPDATNATAGIVPEVTPSNATIFNDTKIPAEKPEESTLTPVPEPTSLKKTTDITEIRDINEHPEEFEGKRVTIIGKVGRFSVGKVKTSATYRGDIKWYWFWRVEAKDGYDITALMECELMEREIERPQQFRSIKVDGTINYFNQIIVESWEHID